MGVTPGHERAQVADLAARVPPHGHQSHTGIHRDEHHSQIHGPRDHRFTALGKVCLMLDDCYLSQRYVLDHARSNDQRLTLMVTKEDLGHVFGYGLGNASGCLSDADLKRAVRQGHELANHTLNHVDMAGSSAATRATQMDDLDTDLASRGFSRPKWFAYPYGFRSLPSDRDVAARYLGFRYSGPTAVTSLVQAADSYRIPGVQMLSDSYASASPGGLNMRHAKELIMRAVRAPVIVCLVNHLGPSYVYPTGSEPSIADYMAFLDWIANLGVPVVTLSEAFSGGNRMQNPGFEDNGGSLDGWPIFGVTASGTQALATGITPYPGGYGSHALRLTAPAGTDGAYQGQRFEVQPGETVWPSCRYKFVSGGTSVTTYVSDDFSPNATDSLGNADTGGAYTLVGTAADFDETSGWATIANAASTLRHAVLATPSQAAVDSVFAFKYDKQPSGQNLDIKFLFRYVDASNYCGVIFEIGAFGFPVLKVVKVVAGVVTTLATVGAPLPVLPGAFTPPANAANTKFWGRVSAVGTTVKVKWWLDSDPEEPNFWTYVFPGLSIPTGAGGLGFGTEIAGGLSNGPVTTSFTTWSVKTPDGVGGVGLKVTYFELDGNGSQVGTFGAPQATGWRDVNRGVWEQLATDAPFTTTQWTRFLECRPSLSGLAATVDLDNFTQAALASQPDGPLG